MTSMTASEAKQNFGQLIEEAQRGPVEITRHGRRVGVFVSDEWFSFDQFIKEKNLKERIRKSREDIEAGRVYTAEEVFAEMRENIERWSAEDKKDRD